MPVNGGGSGRSDTVSGNMPRTSMLPFDRPPEAAMTFVMNAMLSQVWTVVTGASPDEAQLERSSSTHW